MGREVWVVENESHMPEVDPCSNGRVWAFDSFAEACDECEKGHGYVKRYVPMPDWPRFPEDRPEKPGLYLCKMTYGYTVAEWTGEQWVGPTNKRISDPLRYTELPRPPEDG